MKLIIEGFSILCVCQHYIPHYIYSIEEGCKKKKKGKKKENK